MMTSIFLTEKAHKNSLLHKPGLPPLTPAANQPPIAESRTERTAARAALLPPGTSRAEERPLLIRAVRRRP